MKHSMLLEKMMKRPIVLAVVATFVAGCGTTAPVAQYQSPRAEEQISYVGPAGPAGPAGAAGMQGATGYTGAPGVAIAGPAGETGYAGPQGMQGPTGATGVTGRMVVGPAGPRGGTGPAGVQGVAGSTGAQGPTTVGPAGPAGPSGVAGAQGATGFAGAQGSTEMAGFSGPAGATGAAGPQGAIGPTGAQGQMAGGGNARWSSYRDYSFNVNSNDILRDDGSKAREIADYLNQNPSARVAIDGSRERRVNNVRDALIDAGVPAYKIQTGAFGDPQLRRDSRVAVLVSN